MNNTVLVLLGSLMVISSCKYETDGFPDDLLSWIPYEIGDTLSYISEDDTIEFIVDDFFKTGYDSFRGIAMDVEWFFEGYYVTNTLPLGYQIKEKYASDENYDLNSMRIWLSPNDLFYFNEFNNTSINDSIRVHRISDTTIYSRNYIDVFLLEKVFMKSEENIEWLLKSSEDGIIQFYDKKTKRKWTLNNE